MRSNILRSKARRHVPRHGRDPSDCQGFAAFLKKRTGSLLLALGLGCMGAPQSYGADTEFAPSFFVNATGGMSVYKSEMVQSNDTSTTVNYSIGAYAGNDHSIGFMLSRESTKVPFALNDASIALDWEDFHIRYRYDIVHMGIIISESHWTVVAPPDEDEDGFLDQDATAVSFMDITSSGYGANLGLALPIGKGSHMYLEATYSAAGKVRETAADPDEAEANGDQIPGTREITTGPRMDIDIGGSIELTRTFNMLFGYKYRTYQLTVDSTTYKEGHNTTYMGMAAGWSF